MKINTKDYILSDANFFKVKQDKTQILLMDTHGSGMEHYSEWLNKNPLGYKKTTPYTVDIKGNIIQHYDPEYYSKIFGLPDIDKRIIPISVENMGWLEYSGKKNKFINWRGDIYGTEDDVFVKQWRGQSFWAPYTPEQMESLVYLVDMLCVRYDILKRVVDNNIHQDFNENFLGVTCKSNYSKISTDINPSFNINYIKEKIEL